MSKKINLQIDRDVLLTLKATNYEVYQLLNSLKLVEDLGYDYCETLDKEKLAKECGLGYFNIEDLFTVQQIIDANKNLKTQPDTLVIPKKHQALLDKIATNQDDIIHIKVGRKDFISLQETLFSVGCQWRSGEKMVYLFKGYLFLNLFKGEQKTICYSDEYDFSNPDNKLIVKYDFKTEKFIY